MTSRSCGRILRTTTSGPARSTRHAGDHGRHGRPSAAVHNFKFAAALQPAQGGPAQILRRVEIGAEHRGGKPTSKRVAEVADQYAFLVKELGMALPKGNQ
jgi:hypothetical protein